MPVFLQLYLTLDQWILLIGSSFLMIRVLIVLINFSSRLFLPDDTYPQETLVSILIPARNEALRLPFLLKDLSKQTYRNIEILLYNDHSNDHTKKIIENHTTYDSRIRSVKTQILPADWRGKNFACHNLAQAAHGDYYLFIDADVRLAPKAIENALSFTNKKRLSLLSLFPQQIIKKPAEWMTVPLMNWILLSLLPLPFVWKSKNFLFSAANGQFMMFESGFYKTYRWHERVKEQAVEDIEIIRKIKKINKKCNEINSVYTLLGNNDIFCRMYNSYNEAIDGFAKNVFTFFDRNPFFLMFYLLTVYGAGIWLIISLPIQYALIYISGILMIKILVSIKSKQSILKNIIYHVPQLISFLYIVLKSIFNEQLTWKGRKIK